jgi:hypothetical protein
MSVSNVSLPDPVQARETPADTPRVQPARKTFATYCLVLALVPVIAVTASFFIARSDWYLRHQRNSYLAISDFPFTLRNQRCDVLVFGDSSALTGISPPVITAATGLPTCNIAQPNTALALAGTLALDSYLADNPHPKFLVLQFTAPDFSGPEPHAQLNEEGALQLLRHKPGAATFKLFATHPLATLQFSEYILQTALVDRDWRGATYQRAWQSIQSTHGLLTAPGAGLQNCQSDIEKKEPDPAWISSLRSKYETTGTRVLIYVAPYPACDPSHGYYAQRLAGLTDNSIERYDIGLFSEKNHFTLEGARKNSLHIADDIARNAFAAAASQTKRDE